MKDITQLGIDSQIIHSGSVHDAFGSVTVPIYQTSTFRFENAQEGADRFAGKVEGYIYTRIGNPTIDAFERSIALLEGGFGGIATSSGMGAVTTTYLSLLNQGDHMIGTSSLYGPSRVFMEKQMIRFGVSCDFIDTTKVENVQRALRHNTRIIYIESPSNPAMHVSDINAIAKIADQNDALLVVDNTFASPYLQRPLQLGAHIVLHSITKFINGHADLVGGVIVARDEAIYRKLRTMMVTMGCNMDPHQAFLALRGLKTLGIRMERAQANALHIAKWLENHPKVAWVRYIGLPSHPQHHLATQQMRGFGAMISFELKGGLSAGRTLMNSVQLATLAVSLGGIETLIEHPASMTHAGMPAEDRLDAGISDGLVRYSVGIEDVNDLIADLDQALHHV